MAAPIPDMALTNNKEQRVLCVLIVDGSHSMELSGAIHDLNAGLKKFEEALHGDMKASAAARVRVVRFGDEDAVTPLTDWADGMDFAAPYVSANGRTPLGAAVQTAMDMVEEEKRRLQDNAVGYYRPWVFLMSDGEPTDQGWEQVAERARQAQQAKKFTLWPIGIGTKVNAAPLQAFALDIPVIRLDEKKFSEMFLWLSASIGAVKDSGDAGQEDQIALPAPKWTVNMSS